MRRLLLLVLFGLGLVLVTPTAAVACDRPAGPLAQDLRGAKVVFTGRITKIEGRVGRPGGQLTYTLALDTTYKGRVPANARVFSPSTTDACGLRQPKVGQRWLVVSGTTGDEIVTFSYEGTRRLTDAVATQVTAELGEGTPASETADPDTEPATVNLVRVAEGDPASFWPLAMPGVVIALGGLVAIALARALGRTRAAKS